ncbi:MAG: rhomboid family intramembrane serine protease [Planctomycetales bacterium]
MLLPYNTDAPLYHWPYATVGLIVLNTLVFGWTVTNPDGAGALILHYGSLNPVQWITSNFIHAGVLHLAGNMCGLWGFGLFVEGKIGWKNFLGVYLGIGITQCAIEQVLALGMGLGGGSFGASAIVYGLLAMCLVWGPENEVSCVVWFIRPFFFEMNIMGYAAFAFILQITMAALSGFSWGSELLHLMGAAVGLPLAIMMLQRGWVDCEGWDFQSVYLGGRDKAKNDKKVPSESETPNQAKYRQARRRARLAKIRKLIDRGKSQQALAAHDRAARDSSDWSLPEEIAFDLIAALREQGLLSESLPLMVDYLKQGGPREAQVRLQLAQALIEQEQRPAQALRVLEKIDSLGLPNDHLRLRDQLRAIARRKQGDGLLELETRDW